MSSISFDVFTLELNLDAIDTPYRTVSIPSFYTLDKLHAMIVWLFQWSDEHAHAFKIPLNKNKDLVHVVQEPIDDYKNDIDDEKEKSSFTYYLVSNTKSFRANDDINCKKKLESCVMIQTVLHDSNDCITYQYDFDSNINSNWTVFVTLLSTKSIHNFPISDFDPFEFVEIIDGNGSTIPEYDLIDYDNEVSEPFICDEHKMRQYDPKRLNEELQIMRSKYTMFYEDYERNKRKKGKIKTQKHKKQKKHKSKVMDVIHDATSDSNNSVSNESDSSSDYDDNAEFLSNTDSDVYHNKLVYKNDYDKILMYSKKKKIQKNRRKMQCLCVLLILFCIVSWILYLQ